MGDVACHSSSWWRIIIFLTAVWLPVHSEFCIKGGVPAGNFFTLQNIASDSIPSPIAADETVIIKDDGIGVQSGAVSGNYSYRVGCCGEVDQWMYDVMQNTQGCVLKLQIWREVASNKYMLINEDSFTVPSDLSYHHPLIVSPSHPIEVTNGDMLGFTGNCLEFKTSTGFNSDLSGTVIGAVGLNATVGNTYHIPNEINEAADNITPNMIGFAFGASLKGRTTNSCISPTEPWNDTTSTVVTTIKPVDDNSTKPITILNAQETGHLSESTNTLTLLHTIKTVDQNGLLSVDTDPICEVKNVTPSDGGGFSILKVQSKPHSSILIYDGTPPLSSAKAPVFIEYECKDQRNKTASGNFTLYVMPGEGETNEDSLGFSATWVIGAASGAATIGAIAAVVKGIRVLKERRLRSTSKVKPSKSNASKQNNGNVEGGGDSEDEDDTISMGSLPEKTSGIKVYLLGQYIDFTTVQVTSRDIEDVKNHTSTLEKISPTARICCPVVDTMT